MELGKNIKDLRIKYGYTQEKLAEIFSVSTDYLLGRDDKMTLDVTGLSKEIIIIIQKLINIIRNKN